MHVSYNERSLSKSSILIFSTKWKKMLHPNENQLGFHEVSFISALWMASSESWKRLHWNFYAHDCTLPNVWCIKFRSKHNSNTVMSLLRNLMHQTLTIRIPIHLHLGFKPIVWWLLFMKMFQLRFIS